MAKRTVSAGNLSQKFAFYERVVDRSKLTPVKEWVLRFSTRAAISFRDGNEAVIAARLEGKQPAFLTIRSSENARKVTTDWCCADVRNSTFENGKFTGKVYNIRSINEDVTTRQYIRLSIEGGVAIG